MSRGYADKLRKIFEEVANRNRKEPKRVREPSYIAAEAIQRGYLKRIGDEERGAQKIELEPGRTGTQLKRQHEIYTKENQGKTLAEKLRKRREEPIPREMPGRKVSFKPRSLETPVEDVIAQSEKQGFYGPGNREGIQEHLFRKENPYGALPIEDDVRGIESDTDVKVPDTDIIKTPGGMKGAYMKEIGLGDPDPGDKSLEAQQVEEFIRLHPQLMKGAMADLLRSREMTQGGKETLEEAEIDTPQHMMHPEIAAKVKRTTEGVGLPIHTQQVPIITPSDTEIGIDIEGEPVETGLEGEEARGSGAFMHRVPPPDARINREQAMSKPRSLRRATMDTATPEILASKLKAHMQRMERQKARAKLNRPGKDTNIRGGDVSRRTSESILGPTEDFMLGRSAPNKDRIPPGVSGKAKRKR